MKQEADFMDYINDYTEDNSIIYIDGTENEPVPGFRTVSKNSTWLYDPDLITSTSLFFE